MSTVIVDAETMEKLLAAGNHVEVRDAAGKVLRYQRMTDRMTDVRELVADGDWPSDEELDRISKMEGGYTTEQVLAHLRGLSK